MRTLLLLYIIALVNSTHLITNRNGSNISLEIAAPVADNFGISLTLINSSNNIIKIYDYDYDTNLN